MDGLAFAVGLEGNVQRTTATFVSEVLHLQFKEIDLLLEIVDVLLQRRIQYTTRPAVL